MKTNKALYGFLAIGPVIFSIIGLVMFVLSMAMHPHATDMFPLFVSGIALLLLAIILSVACMIVFLIHANKNPALDDDSRIGWLIGMVMLHGIIQIVYYFMHIRKEPEMIAAPKDQNGK